MSDDTDLDAYRAENDKLREQLRFAKLGLLSITLSVDDSPGALMRTAAHALSQVKAADGKQPEPPKPVVIVFDPNEGIQGWLDELATAVREQSGGTVIITEVDAGMSDAMIAVAGREVGTDEAVAIWHGGDDE